ncbi:hypothetical protein PLESTF_001980100 [Pleodorina starrii]|nr:hypothetical protein PLESTF_001980100 [Pleodorina starrii]
MHTKMNSFEEMTGGTGIKGLYGTLTCLSIQLCLYAMVRKAGLRRSSVFVDIGSGINRVLFHALLYPAVEWAFGIEFDPVKVLKAVAAFDYLMQKMPVFKAAMKNKSAPPKANCASISEVSASASVPSASAAASAATISATAATAASAAATAAAAAAAAAATAAANPAASASPTSSDPISARRRQPSPHRLRLHLRRHHRHRHRRR